MKLLLLLSPLLLAGCGPALIAGAVVLGLSLTEDDDDCEVPGVPVMVSVQGVVRYQKRPPATGPGNGSFEPVREARVELLRLNCGEEVIATAETDAAGFYSFSDVPTPSGSLLRVSVLAQRTRSSSPAAVRNNSRERLIYSLESVDLSLTEDPLQSLDQDLDVALDCNFQLSAAFHVLDQARRGFAALPAGMGAPDRALTVFWALGEPEGTFFTVSPGDLDGDGRGQDPLIQLRGGALLPQCQPTDPFDDGVILHEFGHYVAFSYSRDDSPGGQHALGELVDPRLAWSEGWADFFSCLVRNDPVITDSWENLLRNGAPVCRFEQCDLRGFNLESKDLSCSPTACCTGIGSEEAVGALLWDLFDPLNEVNDLAQLPRSDIFLALEALRLPANMRRFVYAGDYIEEVEELGRPAPGDPASVRALARREGMTGSGDALIPFPSDFPSQVPSGTALLATASGSVNGCEDALCRRFVESYIESSDFYDLLVPGQPGAPGSLNAVLTTTSSFPGCGSEIELRVFDQDQAFFHSTQGQAGAEKSIRFGLDSTFRRGSFLLFEVAGDFGSASDPNRGQKADYRLEVTVDPRQRPGEPFRLDLRAEDIAPGFCELRAEVLSAEGGAAFLEFALPEGVAAAEGELRRDCRLEPGLPRQERLLIAAPPGGHRILAVEATVEGRRAMAYARLGDPPGAAERGLRIRASASGEPVLRIGPEEL